MNMSVMKIVGEKIIDPDVSGDARGWFAKPTMRSSIVS